MKRIDFLFKYAKEGKILDVGNLDKEGKLHKLIKTHFCNSDIFGLDVIDQKGIGLNFDNQKVGGIEKIDFSNDFFDTIYAGQVLEHTWEPKKAVDEFYRILKIGGVLIIDLPNVYSLSRILRYLFTGKDIILGNPDHKIFYSRAMMDNLLKSSGFEVKIIETENVFAAKGFLLKIPFVGPFKFLGETIICLAKK